MSFVPDTQNKEFQDALNLIQYTRQSVFLTGKAGTGKSTFLKYICANTKKKHVVLAPTGIAAINAGGSTLHSFFKLPFYPLLPDDPNFSLQRGRIHEFFKYTKPHRKLLEELELVIIDEISMVRADIIDAVDRILRVYSRNLREPFGGKQILLVGDVFQLEPVVKGDEREILNRFYPTPYFFSARVFGQIDLVSIELQTVYRQTDKVFVNVLDHIRSNTVGAADLQLLNTSYGTQIEQSEADMYITLTTHQIGLCISGGNGDQLIQIILRPLIILLPDTAKGHIMPYPYVLRIKFQRLGIIFYSSRKIILLDPCQSTHLISTYHKRIPLNSLRTITLRPLKIIQIYLRQTSIEIRIRQIRLCINHLIEILNRKDIILKIKRITPYRHHPVRIYLCRSHYREHY